MVTSICSWEQRSHEVSFVTEKTSGLVGNLGGELALIVRRGFGPIVLIDFPVRKTKYRNANIGRALCSNSRKAESAMRLGLWLLVRQKIPVVRASQSID